jgi:fructokinase
VADTIGAGDTFHGAFLAWLERKGKMSRPALAALTEAELYNALFFANKAASIVCSRQGAEPPTLREVEALKAGNTKAGTPVKAAAPKAPAKTPAVKTAASAKTPVKAAATAKVPASKAAPSKPPAEVLPAKDTKKK